MKDFNGIYELIIETISTYNEDMDEKINLEMGKDTPLFGDKGGLSSMALVSLMVEIEQAVEEKYEKTITIADEKAFSQSRSPFRTIGSLCDYIADLLNDTE